MTAIKHLFRLATIPLAMTVFLFAAHSTGGFVLRNTSQIQVALR